jgi:hypothetical protein
LEINRNYRHRTSPVVPGRIAAVVDWKGVASDADAH